MGTVHPRRSPDRVLILSLLLGTLLTVTVAPAPVSASESASASASTTAGACTDPSRVTVVVDFTDLGGTLQTGCASSDPATGLDALESAGFSTTKSQAGMICAIDARPDPCPTTFDGSYWSYWHSTPTGSWQSYQVGADSSHPEPGELEGWRYNDGSTGPRTSPSAIMHSARSTTPAPAATAATGHGADTSSSVSPSSDVTLLIALAVAALLAVLILLLLVRSRRRRASRHD